MLGEMGQSEKDRCHVNSLMRGIWEAEQTSKGEKERERDKPKNRLLTVENKRLLEGRCVWADVKQ